MLALSASGGLYDFHYLSVVIISRRSVSRDGFFACITRGVLALAFKVKSTSDI